MTNYINGVLYITRGDSVDIPLTILDVNGQEYELKEGDVVRFTAKERVNGPVILQKEINADMVSLSPEDTRLLTFGRGVFEIEVTLANGNVYTIIGAKDEIKNNLIIWPEV